MSSSILPRWRETIIPTDIQTFLDRFWVLLDSEAQENADAYADLFTEDTIYLVAGIAEIRGRQAIKEQRALAWRTWPGLKHDITRVYKADEEGLDVVAIGRFFTNNALGEEVGGGSAANFNLVKQDGKVLVKRLEVFSDPSPLQGLLPQS